MVQILIVINKRFQYVTSIYSTSQNLGGGGGEGKAPKAPPRDLHPCIVVSIIRIENESRRKRESIK